MTSFEGKTALVLGVANHRSIAWAIGRRIAEDGGRLILTYQGERLEAGVRDLVEGLDPEVRDRTRLLPCDVTRDEEVDALFERVGEGSQGLDIMVHSIAFAKREDLKGGFSETSRDGFLLAQEISAYSLTCLARRAVPLMEGRSGCILAMTFQGSTRVFPGYNVMGVAKATLEASVRYLAAELGEKGVRVNAVSAGPIKTLASAGISGFKGMLSRHREVAPLRRNVEVDEVADAACFLCSSQARGITGEVLHVDAGYHVMGG